MTFTDMLIIITIVIWNSLPPGVLTATLYFQLQI